MAEVREGEWLSRSLESCHELVGIERQGGAVAGCRELSESRENRREGRSGLELSWASSKWGQLGEGEGLTRVDGRCQKVAEMKGL